MEDISLKKIKSKNKAKIQATDEPASLSLAEGNFRCYLCDEIFVHPVTLPCRHSVCKLCLDKHFNNNGFTCPFCRARVSNWLRKLKLINANLVDTKFWDVIKKTFPIDVEAKLTGSTNVQVSQIESASCDKPKLRISQPGEIRKEYEEFLLKQKEEICKEETKNLKLSEALIKMIEEDEAREREKQLEQLRADEELARLMENESSPPPMTTDVVERDTRWWSSDEPSSTQAKLAEAPERGSDRLSEAVSPVPTRFSLHSSTPKPAVHSIPLDTPSTSKDDIFSKYFRKTSANKIPCGSSHDNTSEIAEAPVHAVETQPVPSTFSSPELSHFASVVPRSSTSTNGPAQVQSSMSRSSSGSDSIGQELRHFKPIRTSPTTPPKEGCSSWMPQVVVAQRGDVTSQMMEILGGDPDSDISAQEIEDAIALEKQIEADRELAAMLQKEFDAAENKRKRNGLVVKADYNLRNKKKKGSLRKKVLVDRAQATLDSMLIK